MAAYASLHVRVCLFRVIPVVTCGQVSNGTTGVTPSPAAWPSEQRRPAARSAAWVRIGQGAGAEAARKAAEETSGVDSVRLSPRRRRRRMKEHDRILRWRRRKRSWEQEEVEQQHDLVEVGSGKRLEDIGGGGRI